jgi:hypothetical protein
MFILITVMLKICWYMYREYKKLDQRPEVWLKW